jgi:hypothetical protein
MEQETVYLIIAHLLVLAVLAYHLGYIKGHRRKVDAETGKPSSAESQHQNPHPQGWDE